MAAGILCACLGGLGGAVAWQQASSATPVVVMQANVARGETVKATDLAVVDLPPAPGVKTIPASQLDGLVGQQAMVDLPAGSLVGEGSIGTSQTQAGSAELGLKLSAGRLPSSRMPAGTPVLLVEVPAPGGQATGGGQSTTTAPRTFEAVIVTAPKALPDGGTWVVDVLLPEGVAAEVAQLSSQDRIVLIKRGG